MFWEIKEYFRKLFSMTIRPAMKNLFSSKKSAVGMLCVMLILQTLLSVICITGIENIRTQRDILEDHNANLANYETSEKVDIQSETSSAETEASTQTADESAIGASDKSQENAKLLSSEVSAALNGVPIFAGFLCLWILTATIVYQRISSASADRDKYMWGMYITYGAQRKKVRNVLKYEMYTVLTVATLPSYFIALYLCNYLVEKQGYRYGFDILTFLVVLLLSYVCIRLVVSYEVRLIASRSCTQLLKEEEGPSKLCRPKKNGRLRLGFSPLRYAATSFIRLRKYYVMLALAAAIPAIIWICCQTAAYSQNQYLTSDINEYKLTFKYGIGEDELNNTYSKKLSEIYGISSINSSAAYPADEISMFMLADISNYNDDAESIVHGYDVYADGDAVLVCGDQAFKNKTGFSTRVAIGTVTIVCPNDDFTYNFKKDDKLCVAVSKLDGTVRTNVVDVNAQLSEDLSSEYEYKLFKIENVVSLRRDMASSSFLNIQHPYFVFNEKDYKDITSISADSFTQDTANLSVSFDQTVNNDGSIDLTFDKSELKVIPRPNDTIQLEGEAIYNVNLTTKDGEKYSKCIQFTFNLLNINEVKTEGNKILVNAFPRAVAVMKSDIVDPTVVYFGLPSTVHSNPSVNVYVATDVDENTLSVYNSFVTMNFSKGCIYTTSEIRAVDAGIHLKIGSLNLSGEALEQKLFLESLYANNTFDVICGDKTTSEALGTEVRVSESGTAVIILPTEYAYDLAFSEGDKIRINITTFDVSQYEEQNWQLDNSKTRLEEIVSKSFGYQQFKISEIKFSDTIHRPQIIVCKEDFAKAINKSGPYTQVNVLLDHSIDSERYAALNESLNYELQKISDLDPESKNEVSVVSTGAFLDFMLKKNSNYGLWIAVIGILIPLTLPFIWYYPLATLFERRKYDYITLRNLGKKKGSIRMVFFFESLMVATAALASIALLCYPCMYIFDFICFFFELPIDFNVSFMNPGVFASACIAGVACVVLSFIICYFIAAPRKQKIKRSRKQKGES